METIEHHPANDANKGFSISLGSAWIILADLMANYLFMYTNSFWFLEKVLTKYALS